jgi:hypothetical protein
MQNKRDKKFYYFYVFMETFTKCIIFWRYLRKIIGNITIFPIYLKLENLNDIFKLILYLKMKKYKVKLSWIVGNIHHYIK